MNNIYKHLFFLLLTTCAFSQIGIGTSTVEADATLQLEGGDKGLLIPRVNITDLSVFAPMTGSPVESLWIYNTNTDIAADIRPGYYFWRNNRWMRIDSERDWRIVGDIGTTPNTGVGGNFVGTNDAENFIFATQNTERVMFTSGGLVAVNNPTPAATDRFSVTGATDQSAINGYSLADGIGVRGENDASGLGLEGISSNGPAVYGQSGSVAEGGVVGLNSHSDGTGVIGVGNNQTERTNPTGSGGAFTGSRIGLVSWGSSTNISYGVAGAGNGLSLDSEIAAGFGRGSGGIFKGRYWGVSSIAEFSGSNWTDRGAFVGQFSYWERVWLVNILREGNVYVGARLGNTHYKIIGTGSVSTTMQTESHGERILFAPEAPENWFFDVGEVQLQNGAAKVDLDPIFVECITADVPFKVFIQGGENTLGNIQLERNQTDKTFTLEDQGGSSNGTVYYKIYGIWKGKENLRFPELKPEDLPKSMETTATKMEAKFNSDKAINILKADN